MKLKLKYWWLPVFWAGLIFFVSSKKIMAVSEVYWQDFVVKSLAHVIEYGIFALFLYRALINSQVKRKPASIYTILIIIFYGLFDELHQSFVPGRDPRVHDVLFDTIGGTITIVLIWRLLPILPLRLKNLAKNLELL